MDILLIAAGVLLAVLFFLNLKTAADVLCRIIYGFGILLIYNSAAPLLGFSAIGINLVTSLIIGILGIPGWIMLFCCTVFLF